MATLAYDRRGDGPPLLLLHPLGGDRQVWAPVLDRLAAERDVIAVDLPGFGASPPLPEAVTPTPDALAAAVLAFVDGLDLAGRPHVAGNSLGGWVAMALGLRGAAETVTAIAPAGLWAGPLAPKPSVARRVARLVTPLAGPLTRPLGLRRLVLAGSVAHPERVPAPAAAALVRAYAQAPGFVAVNAAMRAGFFAQLAEIEVPVTLVWAEHDRLVGRPRAVPAGVHERYLADCGHLPMWDDPAAVADVLLARSGARVVAG
jgi:pimeloyl-ACP methyl ester carboxylesterase